MESLSYSGLGDEAVKADLSTCLTFRLLRCFFFSRPKTEQQFGHQFR